MGFDATFREAVIGSPIATHFIPRSENGTDKRTLSKYTMMGEMGTE